MKTRALAFAGADFEDDLQIACAVEQAVDAIATRDVAGFSQSSIPAMSRQLLLTRV